MSLNNLSKYNFFAMTVLLLTSLPLQPVQGQSLQRLFSTPSIRAELDRRRVRLEQGRPLVEEVIRAVPLPVVRPEEAEVIFQMGGIVSRSGGYYTVWVNSQPYPHDQLPENMELLAPFSQGRVRVRNPETGTAYEVLPGQVLNLTTGEILESYQRPVPDPTVDSEPMPAENGAEADVAPDPTEQAQAIPQ